LRGGEIKVKGVADYTVHAILLALIGLALLGFMQSQRNMSQRLLAEKTTGVVAERIAADVRVISGFRQGSEIQVDLVNDYNISVSEWNRENAPEDGTKISVRFGESNSTSRTEIETVTLAGSEGGGGGLLDAPDQDENRFYCIKKTGSDNVEIMGGTC
jgi:hypothetical protein